MLRMKPYEPSSRVAIRESLDEDLSDDIEDDVFIRDGKSVKVCCGKHIATVFLGVGFGCRSNSW